MQAAAQPPGCKAKMACTLNVEQAIAIMSDIDTEPEIDWENEEYSESESDEGEADNSEDSVVESGDDDGSVITSKGRVSFR